LGLPLRDLLLVAGHVADRLADRALRLVELAFDLLLVGHCSSWALDSVGGLPSAFHVPSARIACSDRRSAARARPRRGPAWRPLRSRRRLVSPPRVRDRGRPRAARPAPPRAAGLG